MEFDFKPPPKITRLSPETLADLADDEIEEALVGYVLDHSIEAEDELGAIASLPSGLQAWYIAFVVDAEVLNGGFNQFFFNSSGALAPGAIAAFDQMGLSSAGALVKRALDLLEAHAPALEAAGAAGTIEAFMETYIDQPFSDLDEQYGARQEEWREARLRFIRTHVATPYLGKRMKTTSRVWIATLVLASAAIVALGWYAFSTPGGAPLALIAAAPFVILVRIAVRRVSSSQR